MEMARLYLQQVFRYATSLARVTGGPRSKETLHFLEELLRKTELKAFQFDNMDEIWRSRFAGVSPEIELQNNGKLSQIFRTFRPYGSSPSSATHSEDDLSKHLQSRLFTSPRLDRPRILRASMVCMMEDLATEEIGDSDGYWMKDILD